MTTTFSPNNKIDYDDKIRREKVIKQLFTSQSPNMPREQKNTMTSWIDGSFVYSTKV